MSNVYDRLSIGVDYAVYNGDQTCVVISKKNDDGTMVVLTALYGEAAEYVAELEVENETLKKENKVLRAHVSKSVLRRLDTQLNA